MWCGWFIAALGATPSVHTPTLVHVVALPQGTQGSHARVGSAADNLTVILITAKGQAALPLSHLETSQINNPLIGRKDSSPVAVVAATRFAAFSYLVSSLNTASTRHDDGRRCWIGFIYRDVAVYFGGRHPESSRVDAILLLPRPRRREHNW